VTLRDEIEAILLACEDFASPPLVSELHMMIMRRDIESADHLERGYRGEKGVFPTWINEASRNRLVAEDGVPWLAQLHKALGWQGGTIHQALEAVSRLVALAEDVERKRNHAD
jgi:hypothetical protein